MPERSQLQHYYRENYEPDKTWQKVQIINNSEFPITGPGALCQSSFGSKGNFELVVPEANGLAHYWHDNDRIGSLWQRTGIIAPGSLGAARSFKTERTTISKSSCATGAISFTIRAATEPGTRRQTNHNQCLRPGGDRSILVRKQSGADCAGGRAPCTIFS